MALEQGKRTLNLHLDTHVAIWLAAGERRRLRKVQARLRRNSLFVSPIVLVEMEVLLEIGRIREPVATVWNILSEDHGVMEAEGNVQQIGSHARRLGWTRDPFDRLIVAHALACDAVLLTADASLREHCSQTCWD
jgi:PIN domain nuclease of toxin-antitoxin system